VDARLEPSQTDEKRADLRRAEKSKKQKKNDAPSQLKKLTAARKRKNLLQNAKGGETPPRSKKRQDLVYNENRQGPSIAERRAIIVKKQHDRQAGITSRRAKENDYE